MPKYRYLKQHKTNYVTMWAPVAAKRADQVEISEAEAQVLLAEQTKTREQRMKEGSWAEPSPEAEEPTVVEKEEAKVDMTEPEAPGKPEGKPEGDDQSAVPTQKPDHVDEDLSMLEEIRVVGKGKAQIEAYMKEKYGIDVDRRLKLDELVNQAVAARTADIAQKTAIPVE